MNDTEDKREPETGVRSTGMVGADGVSSKSVLRMAGVEWKEDKSPQLGPWAPGDYCGVCYGCHEKFVGDKRAMLCADCAYQQAPTAKLSHDANRRCDR